MKGREEQGGFAEAVVRIALACAAVENLVDARGFRLGQHLWRKHPVLGRLSHREFKHIVKVEAFMLRFDRERALAALPGMLPDERERREAIDLVRETASARSEITDARAAVLARIEAVLGLAPHDQRAAVA